ncbi:hypothetical protein [Nocardia cyriacigeorgica]|uniref:hypothetical protein n=1 Tax=Nocardia cyriacigeorgica TaxID=135487 RepID=UPI00245807B5|nr:hypothetical protein [Nocardia cyriacigeorgica]
MISETTRTLYENVRPIHAAAVPLVSIRDVDGVDSPTVSTRLCFDCDFSPAVRYCLAAQIETPVRKSVVGRGNKQGMFSVVRLLSGAEPQNLP